MITYRPLVPEDRGALAMPPERVSPHGAIMRFHGAPTGLSDALLDRLLDLEPGIREAVIAFDDEVIVENTAARNLVRSLSPTVTEQYSDGHVVMTVAL